MTYKASVTLESMTQPPKTWRGEVSAVGAQTAFSRAFRAASKAYLGVRWSSCVIVLEKVEEEEE